MQKPKFDWVDLVPDWIWHLLNLLTWWQSRVKCLVVGHDVKQGFSNSLYELSEPDYCDWCGEDYPQDGKWLGFILTRPFKGLKR